MGTYFPPLNLSLDADERAVKRAYAAALKETRPDDDPAAFQALVAARDRALDWVRRRGEVVKLPLFDEIAAARRDTELVVPVGRAAEPGGSAELEARPTVDADAAALIVDISSSAEALPVAIASTETDLPTSVIVLSDTTPLDALRAVGVTRLLTEPSFAAIVRAQQTSRQVLTSMALGLIRAEAGDNTIDGSGPTLPERWEALLLTAEDLDLSGRMMLERAIAIELDTIMQQQSAAAGQLDIFATTVRMLDQAFRWSQDPRRIVRILGEPSGAHPLVFAIEWFGENAIRLRMTPDGFPVIPDGDLAVWFGAGDSAGVKAYRKAKKAGRFGLNWSWHAFLSPPAWCVRTGLSLWGVGFAVAAIIALYVLFDPIANVATANGFVSYVFVLTAARIAAALSARALETSKLVSTIEGIEAGPVLPVSERRRLIAAAHGPKLLNVIVGLFFLLLVDGYCLALIIPAMNLRTSLVADMIVIPDRKIPGVTFTDRLVAQSYLDHAREIAEELDDLIKAEKSEPANPLRSRRIEALQQNFLGLIKILPIGEYAADFERFRREIGRLKRRQ